MKTTNQCKILQPIIAKLYLQETIEVNVYISSLNHSQPLLERNITHQCKKIQSMGSWDLGVLNPKASWILSFMQLRLKLSGPLLKLCCRQWWHLSCIFIMVLIRITMRVSSRTCRSHIIWLAMMRVTVCKHDFIKSPCEINGSFKLVLDELHWHQISSS
jgi:hypothetical protein